MKNSVLLVDDKPSNLIVFEEILSNLNVVCVKAKSGEEAFAKLAKNDISLILLDVQLPGMDGFEILKLIRKNNKWKDIPVIFISAVYKSEIHQIKGIDLGAIDFIVKPVIPEILSGKIKTFLELFEHRRKQNTKIAEITSELVMAEIIKNENLLLNSANEIFQNISNLETQEKAAIYILNVLERITDSKFGFIGELNKNNKLDTLAISNPGWDACLMPRTKAVRSQQNMKIRGIWSAVIKENRSVIENNPSKSPNSVGAMEGHPELTSFIGVPLRYGENLYGMIALANKPGGYTLKDVENVEILSSIVTEALTRKKVELELDSYKLDLEKMVNERTRELELKNKQLRVERSERKAAINTINASPIIAFRWKNVEGLPIEYVSENVKEISGYSVDELLSGKVSIPGLVHPDDLERVNNELIGFSKEKNKSTFMHKPYRILKKNGDILWADERILLIRDNKGHITHFQGVILDITEKKKAEQELAASLTSLRESEKQYRSLIQDNPSVIVVFDPDTGKIIEINNACCRFYGYSRDEMLKMSVYKINTLSKKEIEPEIQNALSNKKNYFVFKHRLASGKICNVEVYTGKIQYGEKEVLLSVIHDITEKVKTSKELIIAKEKAVESDRLKTAFLANMSHEIRTPMNAILGFSQLLAVPGLKDDEIKNYVDTITNSGKQLLSLIDDIISISQIEAGIIDINYENVSTEKILKTAHKLFSLAAVKSGLIFSYKNELPLKYQSISTDPRRIQQVLINLLGNAFKFTSEGSVEFGCRLRNDKIEFYVSDTGIGIKKADEKIIFERFMQIDHGHDVIYGGTGIGLSISSAIVEKLGGKIWVTPKKVNGSEFCFTIPVIEQTAQIDIIEEEEKELDLSGKTILIAEDEEYNYELINILVSNAGAKVLRAKTGNEAVDIVKKNDSINLVLMDIKMPILNGLDATRLIRKSNKKIPIIAQTAYAQVGDRDKILKAGCNDYIPKPIQKNKLFESISKYI